jgi:IS30 family transposase
VDDSVIEADDLEDGEVNVPEERHTKSFCHLSEEDKVAILRAEAIGIRNREIGHIDRRHKSTIARFCKRYAETKSRHRKNGSGRRQNLGTRGSCHNDLY